MPATVSRGSALALRLALALVILPRVLHAQAFDTGWPRQITTPDATITVYEPQPDSLVGDVLFGRAAASVTTKSAADPVFGAIWFSAQLDIDREARTATIVTLDISRIKVPDAEEEQSAKYTTAIQDAVPKWNLALSVDRIVAALEVTQKEFANDSGLKTDAPDIVISQVPAVLVTFDGEPEVRPIEQTSLFRVVNTPMLIVQDGAKGKYYLSNGRLWYSASDPKGPWSVIPKPPAAVLDAVPPDTSADIDSAGGLPPKVITATAPTELIVFDGAPKWVPTTSTEVLYASNTESTVLQDIDSQNYFTLLSGRWFRTKSFTDAWTYVPSDSLPANFAKILPGSPVGDVLASIAGTEQANDAITDAEVPQTAAVKRSDASLTVDYDGDAEFVDIPGTPVRYATNTSTQVLQIGGRYYAVDNGVWFVSNAASGPWGVCDAVPQEVQSIPPSAPVYNVKYVYVYQSTPEIVYVGYLPGYTGSYRWRRTMFYGTGWRYRPWIGRRYYYPRPLTWGIHVRYDPWSGTWGYGLGWGTSFINVSTAWYARYYHRPAYGGWWGAGGYRPVYRPLPGYRPRYRPPRNVIIVNNNYYNRPRPTQPGNGNRPGQPGGGTRPGRPGNRLPTNIYSRPANIDRVAKTRDRAPVPSKLPSTKLPGLPNNVYTDKDGNVYKKTPDGWSGRENGKWTKPVPTPGAKPAPGNAGGGNVGRPVVRPAPMPKPAPTPPAPVTPRPGVTRPAPTQPPVQLPRPAPKPSVRPAPQPAPANLDRDEAARQRAEKKEAAPPKANINRRRPDQGDAKKP